MFLAVAVFGSRRSVVVNASESGTFDPASILHESTIGIRQEGHPEYNVLHHSNKVWFTEPAPSKPCLAGKMDVKTIFFIKCIYT